MDVLSHSEYLAGFADAAALKRWSPDDRRTLLERLLTVPASRAAWGAWLELLFHWPTGESIEPVVARAAAPLGQWDWRIRRLDHNAAVLARDRGVALALVGMLVLHRMEDLHGFTVRALCEHPYIAGLRGLRLHRVETLAQGLAPLTRSESLGRLESLELSGIRLAGGVSEALGGAGLVALKSLQLNSADLASADLVALVACPLARVVEALDLSSNPLTTQALDVLLTAEAFPRLKRLDLSHTGLPADGLAEVLPRLRLPALESLRLAGTEAADRYGEVLSLK